MPRPLDFNRLEPKLKAWIEASERAGTLEQWEVAPEMARERRRAAVCVYEPDPEPVGRAHEITMTGDARHLTAMVYSPREESGTSPPLVLWFHGGGFVFGDTSTVDGAVRRLTNRSGAIFVSLEYRLAPEHPFPAAVDDSWAALCWLAQHGEALGGDPGRIAVGGDSAGGGLAAVTAIRARDAGGPRLLHQLLVYPNLDATLSYESWRTTGDRYHINDVGMETFLAAYVPPDVDRSDPWLSPVFVGSTAGLPSSTIVTAEFDPLRDENHAYAQRLECDGIDVEVQHHDHVIHGFFTMAGLTDTAILAADRAARRLGSSLGS